MQQQQKLKQEQPEKHPKRQPKRGQQGKYSNNNKIAITNNKT